MTVAFVSGLYIYDTVLNNARWPKWMDMNIYVKEMTIVLRLRKSADSHMHSIPPASLSVPSSLRFYCLNNK